MHLDKKFKIIIAIAVGVVLAASLTLILVFRDKETKFKDNLINFNGTLTD